MTQPVRRRPRRRPPRMDKAAGAVATVLATRVGVAVLGMLACLFGSVQLYRRSMRSALWGPYLQDAGQVTIVRYSTPWIAAAAGLALVAGLLLTAAVADLVRWRRVRRAARR